MLQLKAVLLLDDEKSLLNTLSARLELHLPEVEIHISQQWIEIHKLIATKKSTHAMALICDLTMPGIRGDEFCRTVHNFYPEVHIILYTGDPQRARASSLPAKTQIITKGDEQEMQRLVHLLGQALNTKTEGMTS